MGPSGQLPFGNVKGKDAEPTSPCADGAAHTSVKDQTLQPLRLTRAHDMQYTTTVASADRGAKDAGGWTATVMPNGVAAMLPFIAATGLDHADTRIGE